MLPNNQWTPFIININCVINTELTRNSLNTALFSSSLYSVEDEYTRSCDNRQNGEHHEFNKNVPFFAYNCINQNEFIEFSELRKNFKNYIIMGILAFCSPLSFTSESVPYPMCYIQSPQTSGFTKRPPGDCNTSDPCHPTRPMRTVPPVQLAFRNWRS